MVFSNPSVADSALLIMVQHSDSALHTLKQWTCLIFDDCQMCVWASGSIIVKV